MQAFISTVLPMRLIDKNNHPPLPASRIASSVVEGSCGVGKIDAAVRIVRVHGVGFVGTDAVGHTNRV